MKIKQAIMASMVACSSMFAVGSANAAVTYGPVEQVYSDGFRTYIYVSAPSHWAVPGYVRYCVTTDPELSSLAGDALHKNARLICSASKWPTTGAYRSGGTLRNLMTN
jgi:hypothetical protein